MKEQFIRTAYVIGNENIEKLSKMKVAVFGLGGVGGYAAEALCRSGIGSFYLVDFDEITLSNLNRQIIATKSTIGKKKIDVMKERMLDINEEANVEVFPFFYCEETSQKIDLSKVDYIIDAIDSVKSKLLLVKVANELGVPIISSMGTGNKLDPSKLVVTDINKTSVCPLAKVMRYELRKMGIKKLKVVYSIETPIIHEDNKERKVIGSTAFVPSSAGLLIASEVIKDLLNK